MFTEVKSIIFIAKKRGKTDKNSILARLKKTNSVPLVKNDQLQLTRVQANLIQTLRRTSILVWMKLKLVLASPHGTRLVFLTYWVRRRFPGIHRLFKYFIGKINIYHSLFDSDSTARYLSTECIHIYINIVVLYAWQLYTFSILF